MKGYRLLLIALLLSLIIHLPTLGGFFTNDDFFHFQISRVSDISGFINFFNPLHQPQGYGWYRPVANQVYYFIGLRVFSLHPVPMRLMMLINYLLNIYIIWYLVRCLSRSDLISGLAAFLYSVSAALFTSVYLIGVQERPLTLFFLLSTVFFVKFLEKPKLNYYLVSFISFVLALWCKESAVVVPLIFLGLVWYLSPDRLRVSLKKAVLMITPLFFTVAVLLYFKFFFFGFATGDSYVWLLSPRILNTFTWYSLWSVNIPEMFVDYIGPGLHLNPNLLKYWGPETWIIMLLFLVIILSVIVTAWKKLGAFSAAEKKMMFFGAFWFLITVSPVLGLPLHKFPHYLSVPLAGSFLVISVLLSHSLNRRYIKLFLIAFSLLYLVNFSISTKTNWAYTGQKTALRIHQFIQSQLPSWPKKVDLVFYDTPGDSELPWSPSGTLKTILSDNNYFDLYYGNRISAIYLSQKPVKITADMRLIEARQFLGY